jgi:hypothetical protein
MSERSSCCNATPSSVARYPVLKSPHTYQHPPPPSASLITASTYLPPASKGLVGKVPTSV